MMSTNARSRSHAALLIAAMVPVLAAALAAFAVLLMPQPLLDAALAPISDVPPDATERAWLAMGAAVSCAVIGLAIMVEIWSARIAARKPVRNAMAIPLETSVAAIAAKDRMARAAEKQKGAGPTDQPAAPRARVSDDDISVETETLVRPEAEAEAPVAKPLDSPVTPEPRRRERAAAAIRPEVRARPAVRTRPTGKAPAMPAFPAPSPDASITLLLERLERGVDRRKRLQRQAAEAETPLRSVLEELRSKAVKR